MPLKRNCLGLACTFAGLGLGLLSYTLGALMSQGHPINAGGYFTTIGMLFGLAGVFGGLSATRLWGARNGAA
jgi:hypothetical protein